MTGLLDVNALVALFDAEHVHHELIHGWFGAHRSKGWATCPLTENGLVRVLSNPKYPGRRTTVADAVDRLRRFRASGGHVFWPDSVSLCEEESLDTRHVAGHRQVTDVYLLMLAASREGRLVTLDRTIRRRSVPAAAAEHLVVVEKTPENAEGASEAKRTEPQD